MGALITSAIANALNSFLNWWMHALTALLPSLAGIAVSLAALPWVHAAQHVVLTVTWTLLGLRVAYEGFVQYLAWSEGAADADGTVIWKGILRVAAYAAAGGTLATLVYVWGLDFGAALLAAPAAQGVPVINHLYSQALTAAGGAVEAILVVGLMFAAIILAFLIVLLQVAVRAVDLILYILAAPLVALGWMTPNGGVWTGWWQGLVLLALSLPVQWLLLHGALDTAQVFTTVGVVGFGEMVRQGLDALHAQGFAQLGITAALAGGAGVLDAVLKILLFPLIELGFLIAAIRGPHLLQQWAQYRTGFGGAFVYVGREIGGRIAGRIGAGAKM